MLNGPVDPYNRDPLRLDQLVDQTELKKEIEEWMKVKKEEIKKEIAKKKGKKVGIKESNQQDEYSEAFEGKEEEDTDFLGKL